MAGGEMRNGLANAVTGLSPRSERRTRMRRRVGSSQRCEDRRNPVLIVNHYVKHMGARGQRVKG